MADKGSTWIGTRYNMEDIEGMAEEYINKWVSEGKARYCNGQVERCPTTQRLHIQFKLWFKNPVRKAALIKFDKIASFTKVGVDNAPDYAIKEETRVVGPWEAGEKPLKRNDKHDWEEIKSNAASGKLDEIPADVYVRHFTNLQRIHAANLPSYEHHTTRGFWFVGPPGTGKTHYARTNFGDDIYIKQQNKWWDGYKGQKIVVLDDLDTNCLGHHLKIWADRWACNGEIKGATVALQHTHFIVTSNYDIQQLWPKDEDFKLREAIARRFQVVIFSEKHMGATAPLAIRAEELNIPIGAGVHRNEVEGSDTDHTPRVLELESQGSVEEIDPSLLV